MKVGVKFCILYSILYCIIVIPCCTVAIVLEYLDVCNVDARVVSYDIVKKYIMSHSLI